MAANDKFQIRLNNLVNDEIRKALHSGDYFRDVLNLNSRIYDRDFQNVLAVHAQKPDATFVESYDGWKKYNRHIRRNTHSAYAFGESKYLFDVTDTDPDYGKNDIDFGWNYTNEQLADFFDAYDLEKESDRKKIKSLFSDRISSIIRRKNNMMSSETELSENILNISKKAAIYIVYGRLGFELDGREKDFSEIISVSGDEFMALGKLANETAENVLSDIVKRLERIKNRERGVYYDENDKDAERGRDDRRVEGEIYGRERVRVVSGPGAAGVLSDRAGLRRPGGAGGTEERGGEEEARINGRGDGRKDNESLRTGMDGVARGRGQKDLSVIQGDEPIRGEGFGRERGSLSDGIQNGGERKDETERQDAGGYTSKRESNKADYGNGTGDSEGRSSVSDALEDIKAEDLPFKDVPETAVSEETDVIFDIENELYEKEKRESENVTYTQLSLFDFIGENEEENREEKGFKYDYLAPKNEKEVPVEYAMGILKRGTGFVDGKYRIMWMYRNNNNPKDRAGLIKKEYGIGSATWPLDEGEYGVHGYDTFKGNGISVEWRLEDGEHRGLISWNNVEHIIGDMIKANEYFPEFLKMETLIYQLMTGQPYAGHRGFLSELVNTDKLSVYEKTDFLYYLTFGRVVSGNITTQSPDYDKEKIFYCSSSVPCEYHIAANKSGLRVKALYGEGTFEEGISFSTFYTFVEEIVKGRDYCNDSMRKTYQLALSTHCNDVYNAFAEKTAVADKEKNTEYVLPDTDDVSITDEKEVITEAPDYVAEAEAGQKKEDLRDFHYDLDERYTGGEKTRFGWNMEAIKTLKKIEEEGRKATAEEQRILSRYVGWGGLASAFDKNNSSWKKEYEELKNLLTENEYGGARSTVTDAFYTSPYIAKAVSDIVKKLGFDGGNVLEPSMGIGNFFGSMDKDIFDKSRLYGVEIDSISGRIAKQLYQTADIQIKGYENTDFSDNFFDVAIGNVPFGNFGVYDSRYKEKFLIHDYFFAKTLDKVRPGGLIAFITSKGTMDKANNKVRKYINERAEFVGAIRLPNTAFKDTAGTEVTSDIIILKKRELQQIVDDEWLDLDLMEGDIAINSYFTHYPDMVLGTMVRDTRMYGENSNYTSCIPKEGENLEEALKSVIDNHFNTPVYEKLKVLSEKEDEVQVTIPADPNVRNFTHVVVNGDIYFRENSVMKKVAFTNGRDKGRLEGIIRLNEAARKVINLQLEGCTENELISARSDLSRLYDDFVKNYGYITGSVNSRVANDDDNYQFLTTLEEKDEKGEIHKSDFFTKSTIMPKREITEAKSAHEALMYSLNEKGVVDLEYMYSLYAPVIQEGENPYMSIIDELTGAIYLNPETYDENDIIKGWETEDEYLSGNVRRKLVLAEKALDECMDEQFKAYFRGCVDALKKIQPEDLLASEIEVKLGTAWVELSDYEQFIYEKFGVSRYYQRNTGRYYYGQSKKIKLNRDSATMTYYIENKSVIKNTVACTSVYGTSRMDGLTILEKTLNFKQATVWEHDDRGNRWINTKETTLAREKQEILKEEFKDWFWSNDERRDKYVDMYNREFNNTRLREYNGDFFEFPGMNKEIELMQHQKNAVARTLFGGNTLLAHCVGAGKSFEMVASCMEKKRLGLANKPMMVVPNSIVQQTKNEFLRLYPNANLLVAGRDDFSPARRKRFVSKIATGDYDCVIIAHSQFERIKLSPERVEKALNEQIEELKQARTETEDKWTIKQIEKYVKNLETQIQKNNEQDKKDDVIYFDSLGVDCLYVDEAHNYKNMAIYSKISNVAGIPTGSSLKANDMKLKCDYISEISNNKNLIFATGTPISNTMAEMYVMQSYLQGKRLKKAGVGVFDSWVGNFGEITTALELKAEGRGFKFRNRFNKYVNLPELVSMFKEVADIRTSDMLDLDVPKIKGGKAYVIEAEMDEAMGDYLDELVERADMVAAGAVRPNEDNYLKITNEGRLLGTDLRLLVPDAPVNPNGKLVKVAENVYKEYVENNRDGKIGCQLVFSDIGVPNAKRNFDVYNCVKRDLIKMGIPENEIAFIHDAGTDAAKKDALFKKVRTGEVKVLFGSTDKCGTGVNVQTHLVAMHHIDCPWKPSSIEQRDGRGIRQGNENEEVAIYRYITKGTFDAYSWSLIENKQRFISQVMTSKPVGRNCDDIDESVLNAAEIKALATGDTTIKEKMELDNDVSRLKLLKSQFDKNRDMMIEKVNQKYPSQIAELKSKINQVKADLEWKNANTPPMGEDGKPIFSIEIQGTTYNTYKEAGTAIAKARLGEKINIPLYLGKYRGFEITGIKLAGSEVGEMQATIKKNASYTCNLGQSSVGNITKIVNVCDNIEAVLNNLNDKLSRCENDLKQAKKECEKTFPYNDELREKTLRLNELNTKLMVGKNKGEILDDEDVSIDEVTENVYGENEVEAAKKTMVM